MLAFRKIVLAGLTAAGLFATPVTDWSGVALLSVNGTPNCSAVAIAPGALITAAHCVAPTGAASASQNVTALLRSITTGTSVNVSAAAVIPYPTYQASYLGGDIALVILGQALPTWVPIYGLYSLNNELGQVFEAAGFGGATLAGFGVYQNRFENNGLFWASDWLSFDYDSGLEANNALAIFGASDLGVPNEGMIRLGDSGGAAMIDGLLAGIPSGLWRYSYVSGGQNVSADVDGAINSSIGEIGFMVRISPYRNWILNTLAAYEQTSLSSATAVPEPGTVVMTAAGLLVLWRSRRKRP
jgi:hypothetical protein